MSRLQWPKKEILKERMDQILGGPAGSQRYLYEKKIIDKVVDAFQGATKAPMGIDMAIALILADTGIPGKAAITTQMLLKLALMKSCNPNS
jgi:hypothetical protein